MSPNPQHVRGEPVWEPGCPDTSLGQSPTCPQRVLRGRAPPQPLLGTSCPLIPENRFPQAGLAPVLRVWPLPATAGRPGVWFELRVPELSSPLPDGPQPLRSSAEPLLPSPAPCLPHPDSPPRLLCPSLLAQSPPTSQVSGSLHRLSLPLQAPAPPSSPLREEARLPQVTALWLPSLASLSCSNPPGCVGHFVLTPALL